MRIRNTVKITIAAWIACVFFLTGTTPAEAAGTLSIAVSSSTVSAGDTVTVTVYVADANGASATSDMTITYDSSKLEYVSASGTGASGGGGTVKATGSEVSVKFKAVSSGDAYVKAEGAAVTAAGAHIMVSGSSSANTAADSQETSGSGTLSGDNSLSSLKLSAGTLSPAFKGSITNYTASVGSDVSDITVTPVTSSSKATVESITGNTGLKSGENVITVTVKAENGTTASYKITVTKAETGDTIGSAPQGDNTTASDNTTDPADTTDTPQSGDAGENPAGGNAITIDGNVYHIQDDFPESEIPEGFSPGNFEYKGEKHKGLNFEHGHMGLYYLVNEAGEGKFFVYDADRDNFFPYVRLTCGEHFIILIPVSNGAVPPNDYTATTVSIQDETVNVYQYHGENVEIVNLEDTEVPEGTTGSDFYLLYAMDSEGAAGWYQYDKKQGTYQRLNTELVSEEGESADYDTLVKSYNELEERYKNTRIKDRRVLAVLIFLVVVLLIVIVNLVLRSREGEEEYEEEHVPKEKKARKVQTQTVKAKPEKKPEKKPVKKPAKTYSRLEEQEDSSDFYDGDGQDIIAEFEDEPRVLGRHARKKEQPVKETRAKEVKEPVRQARKPEPKAELKQAEHSPRQTQDDEIEFIDLNDL